MLLKRSELHRLRDRDYFFWATGIEDTFIVDPWHKTGRTLDEYALTRHYENLDGDLDLVQELGVQGVRYGIPWYKVQPEQTRWDWSFSDRAFDGLAGRGLDPIVDLMHYGTPAWLDGSFASEDYQYRVAEFAAKLADRYKGRLHWYTPLNEPRITAWYCGRIGWWPPYLRSWNGFVRVMVNVCKGICRTCEALHAVDPSIVLAHVDATDHFRTEFPKFEEAALHRQRLVFLALDLITGRIHEAHALYPWLLSHDCSEAELSWFAEHPVTIDILGINMYPMFSWKRLIDTPKGMRIRMDYCTAEILGELIDMYWERYRVPLFISETAAWRTIARRRAWMQDSIHVVAQRRESGIPVAGYTWWPLFSLFAWGYRQQQRELHQFLLDMGLWDLARDENLTRKPTPLIAEYKKFVSRGVPITRYAREVTPV